MDYAASDFWERLERGFRKMEAFREDIREAKENPVHILQRIDEKQQGYGRMFELTLKFDLPEKTIELGESCVRMLRRMKYFFFHLAASVAMTEEDEETAAHVLKIGSDETADNDALALLLQTPAMRPERIASLIERQEKHRQKSGLPPIQARFTMQKLRQLEEKLK